MRSLMEITTDLEALDELLAEIDLSLQRAEGEVTPEIAAAMKAVDELRAGLGDEFDTKVDNFAAYIRMLKTRSAGRAEEMERLKMRARVDENNAKYLSEILKGELAARDIKKVETRRFKVSVAGNGGLAPLMLERRVQDDPQEAGDYAEPVTTYRLKTDQIRKDLESGKEIPWATLGERGSHLSIR